MEPCAHPRTPHLATSKAYWGRQGWLIGSEEVASYTVARKVCVDYKCRSYHYPQFIKRHGVMENIVSFEKIAKQGYIIVSTPGSIEPCAHSHRAMCSLPSSHVLTPH